MSDWRTTARRACLPLVLALSIPAALAQEASRMRHATGTFEVSIQPDGAIGPAGHDGNELSRMSLDKTFSGDLVGKGLGEMLAARATVPTSASYVAIERVSGTLEGKEGTFVLVHRGVMHGDSRALEVQVSPGSGTGALTGIAGTLDIRIEGGKHFYDLAYTLPEAD